MFGALHQKEMTGSFDRLRRSMFLTLSYINSRLKHKPIRQYRPRAVSLVETRGERKISSHARRDGQDTGSGL
jgi:hypothetical protein